MMIKDEVVNCSVPEQEVVNDYNTQSLYSTDSPISTVHENQDSVKSQKNAEKMSRWAIRMWRKWAITYLPVEEDKGHTPISSPIDEMEPAELDYWLAKFVDQATSENGQPYKFPTMYKLLVNLLPHTKCLIGRADLNFMCKTNTMFPRFRLKLKDVRERDKKLSLIYKDHYHLMHDESTEPFNQYADENAQPSLQPSECKYANQFIVKRKRKQSPSCLSKLNDRVGCYIFDGLNKLNSYSTAFSNDIAALKSAYKLNKSENLQSTEESVDDLCVSSSPIKQDNSLDNKTTNISVMCRFHGDCELEIKVVRGSSVVYHGNCNIGSIMESNSKIRVDVIRGDEQWASVCF
ncbi:hypothetical protein GJ496_006846 [Pomphorhynchus laevis]|nr:hypothetical protein GJ496_006846 [Pomphorhynchus laevis]